MTKISCASCAAFVCAEIRRDGQNAQTQKIHSVTFELIAKARELADAMGAGDVCVAVLCAREPAEAGSLFAWGADRVLCVEHPSLQNFNQEIAANILTRLIEREAPRVVLAPATTAGRTYLPAVAAKLRTGLTADCTGLDIDRESGLLLQTRPAIGGNVMATIKTPNHLPQMATVRPKTFRLPEPDASRTGAFEHAELPESAFESRIRVLEATREEASEADIQAADVVVSGGKGIRKAENFALLRELAELLDGSVGASRPTVEAKWIDYPHQVGLSGKVVAPKVYIAVGISGAVQHLAGMQTAQKIVAINKDPEAPIFRVADVALCGDFADVVPRLIARIRQCYNRTV